VIGTQRWQGPSTRAAIQAIVYTVVFAAWDFTEPLWDAQRDLPRPRCSLSKRQRAPQCSIEMVFDVGSGSLTAAQAACSPGLATRP
jgi:hypothetical protein